MDNRRVLITGGAGFIGSNLAAHLEPANEVFVVDDGSLGTAENVGESVTVCDRSILEDGLPTDVDVVFHLAADSSYALCEADPKRSVRVNVEGFVNVVEQARKAGCDTVVYASTSSVYDPQRTPTSETMPVSVRSAYEASKAACEQYATYFSTHHGMSMAGMRLFSVYQGYGGTETHKGPFANAIAQFADDLAHGRSPTLYGDGTQTRDFIHVDDVVRGLERAATAELDGIYNLGTGEHHTFNTVVDRLNEALGTSIKPTYVDNPLPESVYVSHTCADTAKMQTATSWHPTVGFQDGINRVCEYYNT